MSGLNDTISFSSSFFIFFFFSSPSFFSSSSPSPSSSCLSLPFAWFGGEAAQHFARGFENTRVLPVFARFGGEAAEARKTEREQTTHEKRKQSRNARFPAQVRFQHFARGVENTRVLPVFARFGGGFAAAFFLF